MMGKTVRTSYFYVTMANFTCPTSQCPTSQPNSPSSPSHSLSAKGLSFVRRWINRVEIRNAAIAHLICRVIPTQCPFERTITLFGSTVHCRQRGRCHPCPPCRNERTSTCICCLMPHCIVGKDDDVILAHHAGMREPLHVFAV